MSDSAQDGNHQNQKVEHSLQGSSTEFQALVQEFILHMAHNCITAEMQTKYLYISHWLNPLVPELC